MSEFPRDPAGSWWVFRQGQTPTGDFDTWVQLAEGSVVRIVIRAGAQTDATIAAAVDARRQRDLRWTKTVDRGTQMNEPGT